MAPAGPLCHSSRIPALDYAGGSQIFVKDPESEEVRLVLRRTRQDRQLLLQKLLSGF
jgi:hypothetical protein